MVCPGCSVDYEPRHAQEQERCYACGGLSFAEHVNLLREGGLATHSCPWRQRRLSVT